MKALLLAAALAAVCTPAMADNRWNVGNASTGRCGSMYQNNGRSAYQSGHFGTGYGSRLGYGLGYERGYITRDPWGSVSARRSPNHRGSFDPVHGDVHPIANTGYGSSIPRSGLEGQYYGRGGY